MKITSVEIFCADYDKQAPNQPVFIRINTDEGSAASARPGWPTAIPSMPPWASCGILPP